MNKMSWKVWKKKWFCSGKVWKTTIRFLYEPWNYLCIIFIICHWLLGALPPDPHWGSVPGPRWGTGPLTLNLPTPGKNLRAPVSAAVAFFMLSSLIATDSILVLQSVCPRSYTKVCEHNIIQTTLLHLRSSWGQRWFDYILRSTVSKTKYGKNLLCEFRAFKHHGHRQHFQQRCTSRRCTSQRCTRQRFAVKYLWFRCLLQVFGLKFCLAVSVIFVSCTHILTVVFRCWKYMGNWLSGKSI